MLDVSRHFLPKDDVLRYLDLLAAHKLNVFHFHLTDDQGWRVEIKRYPRLTEVGAWRSRTKYGHRASELWDETPHGGYYTQDDIREIVAYAAERHIRVVPEIDIPGHSQAAISAYPELGNTDVVDTAALSVWDTWGVNPNVLAPSDHTLRFFEGVFEELLELFPAEVSPFVHVGGDECPKDQWKQSPAAQARIRELGLADEDELQSWFIRHFDSWLTARGRMAHRLGRDPGGRSRRGCGRLLVARVRGRHRGRRGRARRGDVPGAAGVPGPPSARRSRRADAHRVRPHAGGRLPLRTRTASTLSEEAARHVLGTQANVWTEVMQNRARVDYQVFPASRPSPRSHGRPCPPPRAGTSRTSSAVWPRTTGDLTRSVSTTGRRAARCRGSGAPGSSDARSREHPERVSPDAVRLPPPRSRGPWWRCRSRREISPGEPPPAGADKSYKRVEQRQFTLCAEEVRKGTIPLVGDGYALRGPSRRAGPKMCQSCHVRALSTYRTAKQAGRRDTGKGQLG